MQTFEEKNISDTTQNLQFIAYGLSYEAQQAWTFTRYNIEHFLTEHPPEILSPDGKGDGELADELALSYEQSVKATALLAAGRLDLLLQSTRPHLSGVFSERDVVTLLDCYQGGIFFPGQFNSISTDLCDHLGVEVDEYEASSIAPLVEKLLGLDAVQRVTLGDALEQAWHRGMKQQGLSPKDFFATLGIELT